MLWIEAVRMLSADLEEPFALEFVYRNLYELTKLDWLNLQRQEITDSERSVLTELAKRLKNNEPPQYIVGWAEFCDLRFKVDGRVLIPRPETEELVQLILSENAEDECLSVLDIGTGSGAIAVALASKRKNWLIEASDLSSDALSVAVENADRNVVSVHFTKSDVLSAFMEGKKFDIIVSNPPYIAFSDTDEVDDSVIKYEPDSALFAAHEGLAIYEKIAKEAPSVLTENGRIYLEIGYKQGQAVSQIFQEQFADKTVTVHQDIFGKDRMISVK